MGSDGIGIGCVGRRRAAAGVESPTPVSVESTQRPTGCKTSRLLRVWGFARVKVGLCDSSTYKAVTLSCELPQRSIRRNIRSASHSSASSAIPLHRGTTTGSLIEPNSRGKFRIKFGIYLVMDFYTASKKEIYSRFSDKVIL